MEQNANRKQSAEGPQLTRETVNERDARGDKRVPRPGPDSPSSLLPRDDRSHLSDSDSPIEPIDLSRAANIEQSLRDNAQWNRLIAEYAGDILWIGEVEGFERGADGVPFASFDTNDLMSHFRFLYVSPAVYRVVGYSSDRVMEMNIAEFVAPDQHGMLSRQFLEAVSRAIANPESVAVSNVVTTPLATATGSCCWCETCARVVYDESRNAFRFVGITRDITHRHRAEETLRASEEKLRAICDAVQDAVIMIDSGGRMIHCNPATETMFGRSRAELLGHDMHLLLSPHRLHEKIRRGMRQFHRTGQGPVLEQVIRSEAIRKDGTEFPVEITVSPIMVDGSRSAVGTIRDITNQVLAEQVIRDEQRRLARLLDVYESHRKMATYEIHDGVTQPLVSALMTLEAFSRVRDDMPEASWSQFDAAIGALRDVLTETRRFMSGMRPPMLDELGVVAAVDHLIREHRVSGKARIDFACDMKLERLAPPLETCVFRIVQEGLANAQRHSGSTLVHVAIREQDDRLEIIVQDWGAGFDPAGVAQDRFGLEGIRERANALGGVTSIETALGKGTCIRVDLPLLRTIAADARNSDSDET